MNRPFSLAVSIIVLVVQLSMSAPLYSQTVSQPDVTFKFLELLPPDASVFTAPHELDFAGEWRVTNNEEDDIVKSITEVEVQRWSVANQAWVEIVNEKHSKLLEPSDTKDIRASGVKELTVPASYRVLTRNSCAIVVEPGEVYGSPIESDTIIHYFTVEE